MDHFKIMKMTPEFFQQYQAAPLAMDSTVRAKFNIPDNIWLHYKNSMEEFSKALAAMNEFMRWNSKHHESTD